MFTGDKSGYFRLNNDPIHEKENNRIYPHVNMALKTAGVGYEVAQTR